VRESNTAAIIGVVESHAVYAYAREPGDELGGLGFGATNHQRGEFEYPGAEIHLDELAIIGAGELAEFQT
jgi:hypothetical protein